ncbi:MAG TPA: zinc-binding alcohol dehydrogenase family protein [Solirubrobacteraceae bacterium]|nr:zinc-binding alcohol dehydrogenase family protein [Solirubrobacteraceae bacterium]
MSSDHHTVRAARLVEPGQPLRVEDVELPAPSDGEVRVDLRYGGVNPVDRYVAEGRAAPDGPRPRTLGGEASGALDGRLVLVAGEGLGAARDGVWAQGAVVPAAAVVRVPADVELPQAAAMGIAGLTALNCVRQLAQVTAEDRVVVLGASGGVGSMIVSLARAAGATVWGQTGAASKAAAITEDGAHRVLVGGPEEIAGDLADFEPTVAFDPLGDGFVAPLVDSMQSRGRIVSLGVSAGAEVTFNIQLLYRKMLSLLGYGGMNLTRDERRPGLEAALEAVRAGDLTVRIDTILPLEEVNEAFRRLTERRVQGNLLLDLS